MLKKIVFHASWWFVRFFIHFIILQEYKNANHQAIYEVQHFVNDLHMRTISLIEEVFNGIRVTRSLVVCVCFVDRRLSFCRFSFGHRVVYPFSIHGFWLPSWHLQTLLAPIKQFHPVSFFVFFLIRYTKQGTSSDSAMLLFFILLLNIFPWVLQFRPPIKLTTSWKLSKVVLKTWPLA